MGEVNELQRKKVRRLLWRWGRVAEHCANLQRELNQFKALVDSALDVHCSPLSDMPKGNSVSDTVVRKAEKHEHLKALYEDKIDSIEKAIEFELKFSEAMDDAINSLDSLERSIVEFKYKREFSFCRIAYKMKYSEDWVKQVERRAVDKLCSRVDVITV